MTIPSVAPKHVEDDEHSEHECNSCVFSLEEEEEPSSHSYCIGSVYEDDINSRMVKTVTVIISHGSIVEEGDYFHTTIDESGRLVYTPNLSINSQNLTTFLPLISNIVQLSTNGDYYIKCQSQPTDEDITAIFGPDCLVQVIKVDAICSYYHDRRIDVSSTDCTKNKSNPLSLTDAKNISNPSNRWNHHLSAISVRGLKVVQLFHQATSKDVVEPEKHQQTQSSTVSTIRRLSKTSFPEVFHKCKLGPHSSNTTCDKEYDQQDDVDDEDTYEENVNAARNIPNLNDVSSSQTSTSCDDRPRRLTLFRKTL
jgi:hypothetical protein